MKKNPMLTKFCPLKVMGAPVMKPCNFPERHDAAGEREEAEEDLEPERLILECYDVTCPWVFRNSLTPTSAVASPPKA